MEQDNKAEFQTKLDLVKRIDNLLQGRPLEQLTDEEQRHYYSLIKPFTSGTVTEYIPGREHDSPVRQGMAASHNGQGVPTVKTGKSLYWSGVERSYGKAMFDESVHKDIDILEVIPRYTMNELGVRSPYDLVIYECDNHLGEKELGFYTTQEYRSNGLKFGQRLDFSATQGKSFIGEDEIIGRDTMLSKEGDYQPLHECVVCFNSSNIVSEDQYHISDEVCDTFRFYLYQDETCAGKAGEIPLNIYGTPLHYQSFPLPGQKVRPDGILMAYRKLLEGYEWLDASEKATREIHDATDRIIHVNQSMVGYASVYDIEVLRGNYDPNRPKNPNILKGTEEVLEILADLTEDFYGRVCKAYLQILHRYNLKGGNLSFKFSRFLYLAMIYSRNTKYCTNKYLAENAKRIDITPNNNKITDYQINFKLIAEKSPFAGDKWTDQRGTKGVAYHPTPKADMPTIVLPNGTKLVADFCLSWLTVVKRMNKGQMYTFEVSYYKEYVLDYLIPFYKNEDYKFCFETIMKLYRCVSEEAYLAIKDYFDNQPESEMFTHVDICMNGGLVFFNPNHEYSTWYEKTDKLAQVFPFVKAEVIRFRGRDGKMKTSKMPGKLATKGMLLLEKHPEIIACGSSLRNHFGQPAIVTKETRSRHQVKIQAVRGVSETEGQAWLGINGQTFPAEMFDRTTNTETNQMIVDSIIDAICPTNIPNTVDRVKIPLGGSKTIAMLKNNINAAGFTFE